ncbi:DUF1275 domain-containing protein [Pleurostoma richardsiae]|uniref:DUF1275 domain-containing protein n=1 Tax=Pleurostoma richardsiae TaxID=41990 RepID=A0AA38VXE7_9PEZI|nr:DUF1275 domain-containing protein [Pleurostoma richardsiae]
MEHLIAPVRPSLFAELELIILTFCTGLQDAISFPDYHCFASNQTGNTVFLMLAVALPNLDGDMFVTANIGAALGFFLAGGWVTGQVGHIVGPRRRLWLVACNLIQTCLVFAAAAIQYTASGTRRGGGGGGGGGVRDEGIDATGWRAVVVVGLLAFASGSQVVQSRALRMTEISTAMATAAWVDLLIDPSLFGLHNRPRNRRVAFLVTLVLGSLAGAYIYKAAGSAVAVFVSACGKLLVTAMYLFNEGEKEKVSQEAV